VSPEDAAYYDYRAAELEAREREEEEAEARRETERRERSGMTVQDALRETARLAKGRAEYFECRAGRRDSYRTPAATEPAERARFERDALAFGQAAAVITTLADTGKWP